MKKLAACSCRGLKPRFYKKCWEKQFKKGGIIGVGDVFFLGGGRGFCEKVDQSEFSFIFSVPGPLHSQFMLTPRIRPSGDPA